MRALAYLKKKQYFCAVIWMSMRIIVLTIGLVLLAVVLLSVGVIFRKDHQFRSQHIHQNARMKKDHIHCAIAEDAIARRKRKEKKEALTELRDTLATLRFNLSRMTIEQAKELNKKILSPEEFEKMNPELKIEVKRESFTGDIHLKHMEERKNIYQEVKWNYGEAFEEEIMHYKDKEIDDFDDVYSFVDNIDLENKNVETNYILAPVLRKRLEHKKYDMKEYMKKNYNK